MFITAPGYHEARNTNSYSTLIGNIVKSVTTSDISFKPHFIAMEY